MKNGRTPFDPAEFADFRRAIGTEPTIPNAYAFSEEGCPGHVASEHDGKVCGNCGVHIDSLRPPEDE